MSCSMIGIEKFFLKPLKLYLINYIKFDGEKKYLKKYLYCYKIYL